MEWSWGLYKGSASRSRQLPSTAVIRCLQLQSSTMLWLALLAAALSAASASDCLCVDAWTDGSLRSRETFPSPHSPLRAAGVGRTIHATEKVGRYH